MDETVIPQLNEEAITRIKKIVQSHYHFEPSDSDITWIDRLLRSHYETLHDQRIIRYLVHNETDRALMRHRERLGSLEFERIWHEKAIFTYLMFASMCYRAGIPAGVISLCRTAIEAGLRERLAEKLAEEDNARATDMSETVIRHLESLRYKPLRELTTIADQRSIITTHEIEQAFRGVKFEGQTSRRVLDKFIHWDIVWMADFVRARVKDSRVIGAESVLEEYKIVSEMYMDELAIEVLKASYEIAELLYLRGR